MLPTLKVLLALFSLFSQSKQQNGTQMKKINVGLMCADSDPELVNVFGWSRVAAGVGVAWDKIVSRGILTGYELNLTFFLSDCIESNSVGAVIESSPHDVLLGSPCSVAAVASGSAAKYFGVPMIMYGPQFDSVLQDRTGFPTVMATTSAGIIQSLTLLRILNRYNWTDIATVFYEARSALVPRCTLVLDGLDQLLSAGAYAQNVVYRRRLRTTTIEEMVDTINDIWQVSRVTVSCLESKMARRNWLLAIAEAGAEQDEFVWIQVESRRAGFHSNGTDLWQDIRIPPDGNDQTAKRVARKMFLLDTQPLNSTKEFVDETIAKFKEPPYNCDTCTDVDPTNSQLGELADAMMLYGILLNKSVTLGKPNPTGYDLAAIAEGTVFEGYSGTVLINKNLMRTPVFKLWILDGSDVPTTVYSITEDMASGTYSMEQLATDSAIFVSRGGQIPLNFPICGYDGTLCPPPFLEQYLGVVIGCTAAAAAILFLILAAAIFLIRYKAREEERLNRQWQILFQQLEQPDTASNANRIQSQRSLQSSVTTSTRLTINSKKETENTAFYLLNKEEVVALKHHRAPDISKEDAYQLRKMKNCYHENLCGFEGMCLDGPQPLSIWRYCQRGSIKDVIAKGAAPMDYFFKYSLIRDIADGLHYIHEHFGVHGWLTSGLCIVDSRWRVQISFYGLQYLKAANERRMADLIWAAPEIIRGESEATKEADIYSFAIICSEILTKRSAWDMENQSYDIEELLYRLKKGGAHAPRPKLDSDAEHNSSLFLLVRDCWDERPQNRPIMDQIKRLLRGLNHNQSSNLMDHVFKVLEQYAQNLEVEVESRMRELTEEKKRSDVLLYRMLPKGVADRLKLGQSVEPEAFECVTIFFSDVVSFTTLASRCTPLQVVNLLNDLYTTFDAIIDNHDVYKVETIGDGYLCVSGLPHRNGNEHAREIAEMSKELLAAIKDFRIPHLPTERISIRIGLHTGSVVTGVVGITMPRYCLFGDAVNMASRMESNGKPGRIHISTPCMEFLTKVIGGYRTEPRGEVIVKGTGAVLTHWLIID